MKRLLFKVYLIKDKFTLLIQEHACDHACNHACDVSWYYAYWI